MSHIAVLVIGENVDEQLAPFQESYDKDDHEAKAKYFQFVDQEAEFLKEYNEEGVEMVRLEDGGLVYSWNEQFRVPGTIGTGSDTHRVPSHLKEVMILHRDRFATLEEFVKEWHSQDRDPDTGRYGYWKNPNAQWDWYVEGGRYKGRLKLKNPPKGPPKPKYPRVIDLGLTGAALAQKMNEDRRREAEEAAIEEAKGFVNSARLKDLDWEGMRQKRLQDRRGWWAGYEIAMAKRVAEGRTPEQLKSDDSWERMCIGAEPTDTQETYVAKGEEFSVFAVLKDGKWYQRGEMGWWGCVGNEKEDSAWRGELKTLMADLSPDTLLTIVDCHI